MGDHDVERGHPVPDHQAPSSPEIPNNNPAAIAVSTASTTEAPMPDQIDASLPVPGDASSLNCCCCGSAVPPSKIADLILRISATILTLISLSLVGSDNESQDYVQFSDYQAYNYLLAASVLSFLYSLVQIVFVGFYIVFATPKLPIVFYAWFSVLADLFCAVLLLSGSAATFGVSQILQDLDVSESFTSQANASASMALLAFLFVSGSAILSTSKLFAIVRGK